MASGYDGSNRTGREANADRRASDALVLARAMRYPPRMVIFIALAFVAAVFAGFGFEGHEAVFSAHTWFVIAFALYLLSLLVGPIERRI